MRRWVSIAILKAERFTEAWRGRLFFIAWRKFINFRAGIRIWSGLWGASIDLQPNLLLTRAAPSSVNAPHPSDVSDPVDRQHIGGDAVVYAVIFGVFDHVVEAGDHNVLQPLVDQVLFPEIAHTVLNPFEVAAGHPAGVRQDVGDDEDAFAFENIIGGRRGRTVGAFGQNPAFDSVGVMTRDLIFCRGGQ